MPRRNPGEFDFDRNTNLFDDPERDLDSSEDGEELWLEETFDLDVDERCGVCHGEGLVVYPDESEESECHACNGVGFVTSLV